MGNSLTPKLLPPQQTQLRRSLGTPALPPQQSQLRRLLGTPALVWLLTVLLAVPLSAQYMGQAKTSRMRAVGILRIDPQGKARLFPVTLFIDGKYYDARFYEANPVPFAIAGDIYYQAEKDGTVQGDFVVQTTMHTTTRWWAEGIWKPGSGEGAKAAKAAASRPSADADSGRPVLRRAPSSSSDSSGSATAGSSGSATPSKDGKATGTASSDAVERAEEQDPGRPTLHRGKSEQIQADVPVSRSGGAAVSNAPAPALSAEDKVLLAVADVGSIESRPYAYKSSEGDREHDLEVLRGLASDAIRKAAKQRASLRGVDAAKLEDVDVHLLDPDYSNRPLEIFTATITGAQSKLWLKAGSVIKSPPKITVALVARKDSTGRLNQIFVMIADPEMLDVRPALHYLGAVDADGSGRAQLLFRKQVDANAFAYVLYRATPYDLIKTFETKAAEE
jgi:hypothetical protein